MAFVKRIFLFLTVNILVVTTISFLLNFFQVKPYLQAYGISYPDLIAFCLIWGFGGAFISLALSRVMAKWMMGVRLIDPNTTHPEEKFLLDTVRDLVKAAHLAHMPEVGIYDSPEANAFATGPTKKRALVAVSSGLLSRMSNKEIEGVLSHEISHIANGDMVTMTLVQGIVNAFVMFLARVLAFAFSNVGQKDKSSTGSYLSYNMLVFVFELVFMFLGYIVIATYSRFREFRADRDGALIGGRDKMILALQALQRLQQVRDVRSQAPAYQTMKISNIQKKSFFRLFATHPPLEDRIERLKELLNY